MLLLFASWLWVAAPAVAQAPGSNDASFNVLDDGTYGDGANSTITAEIVLQPDGRVLIGGDFTSYNGTIRNRIARLNADGSLDSSFNPGSGASLGGVSALALQPDGKVLIGGGFTSYNGTPRNRIARLNADGSLDTSFDPGSGSNGLVTALALQPDGKVVIGGSFLSYNGVPRDRVARVNADGSLDVSFDVGTGASTTVERVALQPDGKVLIAGSFTSFNGTPRNRIARLNADGSIDTSFDPGSGADGTVNALTVQPDGKLVIGGAFTSINGVARNRIARLNADGSVDLSFDVGTGAAGTVISTVLQADGKVLIGGVFSSFNGTTRNYVARLNADGSLDTSFDPGAGANNAVRTIALRPDGTLLIGGDFFVYGNKVRFRIARINTDGSLDSSFNPGAGASGTVLALAVQSDGKILIGGGFLLYNDTVRNRIARLNVDGSLDTGFSSGAGANGSIFSIAPQADGKVLIGGEFTSINGIPRGRIARLDVDGSLDVAFDPGSGASSSIDTLAVQPDGKIVIGGFFTNYNGTARNRVARLNSDGSLDASFNPGSGANDNVDSMALQPDGRILISGSFTSFNGVARGRVARLNSDGSLDASFTPGTGASNTVHALALQSDGKIVIAGRFTAYNGATRMRIARINSDGSLDASFAPGTGASDEVYALTLQPDGKMLIGGIFTAFSGTARNFIARVNADGSLDTGFDPGSGANQFVYALAQQPDGRALLGGNFTRYNGVPRHHVARVHVFEPYTTYCDGPALACPCGNSGTAGNGCGNSIDAAGANLAASGYASLASDTLVLAGSGMPNSSALYFQGTTQSGGGLGTVFGDGMRCAGGAVIRLGTKINASNASSYPEPGDASISVRGAVTTPGSLRTYQCWYRNAAAFCTPSTFNLSNGVSVTWGA